MNEKTVFWARYVFVGNELENDYTEVLILKDF